MQLEPTANPENLIAECDDFGLDYVPPPFSSLFTPNADGATLTQEAGRIIKPLLLNEGRRIGSVSQHALRLEQ